MTIIFEEHSLGLHTKVILQKLFERRGGMWHGQNKGFVRGARAAPRDANKTQQNIESLVPLIQFTFVTLLNRGVSSNRPVLQPEIRSCCVRRSPLGLCRLQTAALQPSGVAVLWSIRVGCKRPTRRDVHRDISNAIAFPTA